MALRYHEVLPKRVIELDGEPYLVLEAQVTRKQQNRPVNQTRLKHLRSGRVIERTFHQNETVEEAEVSSEPMVFAFRKRHEFHFHAPDDKARRIVLREEEVGAAARFLVPHLMVTILSYEGAVLDVILPVKVDLKVVAAPPSVRGDTAQGGSKIATLESGAEVSVPLFVEVGDVVRVNTQTGAYVERVAKKK